MKVNSRNGHLSILNFLYCYHFWIRTWNMHCCWTEVTLWQDAVLFSSPFYIWKTVHAAVVFSHLQLQDPTGANCQPVAESVFKWQLCGHFSSVWSCVMSDTGQRPRQQLIIFQPAFAVNSCCSPSETAFMSLILAYLQYADLITWTLAGVTTEARISSCAHHTLATPTVPIVNSDDNSSDTKHWKKCWNVVTPLPYFKIADNWDSTLLSAMYYVHILLLKYL